LSVVDEAGFWDVYTKEVTKRTRSAEKSVSRALVRVIAKAVNDDPTP
jgi:hypothetical protein